jgi:hypothetical protein
MFLLVVNELALKSSGTKSRSPTSNKVVDLGQYENSAADSDRSLEVRKSHVRIIGDIMIFGISSTLLLINMLSAHLTRNISASLFRSLYMCILSLNVF